MPNNNDDIFQRLIDLVDQQKRIIHELTTELKRIKAVGGGGGGGTGTGFQVYESGSTYKKYQALIDPNTDTAYLVVPHEGDEYVAISVEQDCLDGNLKLLGYDGQVIAYDHTPLQSEIDRLPANTTVVEYNTMDTPYSSILLNDNQQGD
jgi:hypothetical protein